MRAGAAGRSERAAGARSQASLRPARRDARRTWIIGALTHAPRHSTSVSVKKPSAVDSPHLIPRWASIAARISYAPQTMQGVVAQSWMWNLPCLFRLYMVKKVATS